MDRDAFRREVRQRLEGLPWELVVAFAARAALRVLPVLAKERRDGGPFLWFWPAEQREKHMLAVLRGIQVAWGYYADAAADAADAAADDAVYAVYAAAAAADAAAYAAYAADAADAAVVSTLLSELANLAPDSDVSSYLAAPCPHLPGFSFLHAEFIASLRALGSGFDYWAAWYEDRVAGRPWDPEVIRQSVELSKELLAQPPEKTNAYLKAIRDRNLAAPLNRVRALFIGYGAAGKTSVIRRLHGEAVVAGKEKMTPGIAIREWPLPGSEIKALLWDFGGQVMAHATHQFFLRERCVYVVVLDGRADVPGNEQAEYWLEHVRAFGAEAPVLLIGNKAEQAPVHLDMQRLRERYPNIVGFYPLSCVEQERFGPHYEVFLRDFIAQLQGVGTHQVLFPAAHAAVLEALRGEEAERRTFLARSEFEALCERHGVVAEGDLDRAWLLDLLDKLGVIVHFREIAWLDGYVLNPRWLTYGVYTLLYANSSRQGRMTEGEIIRLLQAKPVVDELGNRLEYPPDKCRFIIDAMEQFQLCYRLPEDRATVVIPDLLPSDQPAELAFDGAGAMAFDFDFEGLLPRHLMPALIVQRHHEIAGELVWQQGVRLSGAEGEAEALIQADYHDRRLSLRVSGAQAGRYFAALHDQVMGMLKRMPKLRFDEWVVLPGAPYDTRRRAAFRDLLALEAAGEPVYTCRHGRFPLAELLGGMPMEFREKQPEVSQVRRSRAMRSADREGAPLLFISYAHEDRALVDQLHKRLKPLQRSGKIRTWHDRDIPPGEAWEAESDRNLEEAEVILLLVSPDFIASDYCWGREVTRAMERHRAGDARVVPVILRPEATWQEAPFGELQAVPEEGRPVTKWQDPDEAWANVVKGIQRALMAVGGVVPGFLP